MTLLSAAFGRLFNTLAIAAALILLGMVVIVTADIVLRNSVGSGIVWANEVSEYSLYLMTLLTAPWLLRRGQHVRLDIILTLVPARVAWLMEAVGDLLGFAVCIVLVRYGSVRSPSRTWCLRNGGCWRRCRPRSSCSPLNSSFASTACCVASGRAASRPRR
jgi:TRAP-type C4-dicarboxylate transport system permease small subunit